MTVQYHVAASSKNLRCKICGKYFLFDNIRVCLVCGIILCKQHCRCGFCEQHYEDLIDSDKKKVQECLQNIAKSKKISGWLALAWIASLIIPFLVMFLAGPGREAMVDFAYFFMAPFLVLTFIMMCDGLVFRIQKDDNDGEIQRIAKRYEKKHKELLKVALQPLLAKVDLDCPNCGSYNLANAKFCSTCGKEIELIKSPKI